MLGRGYFAAQLVEEVRQHHDVVSRLSPRFSGEVRIQDNRESLAVGRQIVGVAATQIGELPLGPNLRPSGVKRISVAGVASGHDPPIRSQEEKLVLCARPYGVQATAG